MKRVKGYLTDFVRWIMVLYLLGVSFGLFALAFDVINLKDLKRWSTQIGRNYLLYTLASVALSLALYFIMQIRKAHKLSGRIKRAGAGGPIQISPRAIRKFVREILKRELGLSRFRVKINRGRKGINILVRISLKAGQSVVKMGGRIQELIKRKVKEKIGIEVDEVEVFTQSIEGEQGQEEGKEDKSSGGETPPEMTAPSEESEEE